MGIRNYYRALKQLPKLVRVLQGLELSVSTLMDKQKQMDAFVEEVGSQLSTIDKAASMIAGGYAHALNVADREQITLATIEDVDRQIGTIQAAIRAADLQPSIGSAEINRKAATVSRLERQLDELIKRRGELNERTRTS